ncbi:MAG: NAD(P)-dependent oxidoreductase [Bosea sp.]|uniref:NAD-dependent epimerase/dehydratase family protein n=1 Tax=Bosea sp. (in: a-proteobacteria) TaxID=1871050 RepID=UPI001AC080E3|nr:NAD(P)-dependent oxidoreductase [Bosea sp. (in: a-proteobacteria)]MBN9470375.1 NAD(P)-dependent oxidoreductase [Bosea sp. (in: a-proteobacteria)]
MNYERVLVTGAAGKLGQAILRDMAGKARLTGFDLHAGAGDIDWRTGTLTDAAAVADAVKGQDAILQVGAIPNIWSGSGEALMQVNLVGLYNLLSAAEEAGVKRVIFCSSDSVVGFTVHEGALRPPEQLPIDLTHPLNPTDPYALSKLLGEEMCRSFTLRGKLEIIAMRPVFVAYPEMYGEIRARSRSPQSYKGTPAGGPSSAGGGPCWHHVDPRDAARAFRLALEMRYQGFDRFFVCGNVTLHPQPTLQRLESVLGYLPRLAKPEIYAQNPFAPLYDLSRSREILGFDAEFDARAVSLLQDGEAA